MITKEKVLEYWHNKGSFDGFYMQKVRYRKNSLTEDEWWQIDNFIQKYSLVLKGLTSDTFNKNLEIDLEKNCDSMEAINKIKQYAKIEINSNY